MIQKLGTSKSFYLEGLPWLNSGQMRPKSIDLWNVTRWFFPKNLEKQCLEGEWKKRVAVRVKDFGFRPPENKRIFNLGANPSISMIVYDYEGVKPLPFNPSLRSNHLVQGWYAQSSASVSRAASSATPSWPATVRLYDTSERCSNTMEMTCNDEKREVFQLWFSNPLLCVIGIVSRELSRLNHRKSLKHIKIRATQSTSIIEWLN